MAKLKTQELKKAMAKVPDWRRDGDAITRTFVFTGFLPAIRFVNKIAELAEAAGHHPDIDIRWNQVTLTRRKWGSVTRR